MGTKLSEGHTSDHLLELFERSLRSYGIGQGPNRGVYLLDTQDGHPVVLRRVNREKAETIVGFDSHRFDTREQAITWAITDGRHEWGPGKPLSERKQIC